MTTTSANDEDLVMSEPGEGVIDGREPRDSPHNGSGSALGPANERATASEVERFSVVVIGGGQTGLARGCELAQRGIDFVILDKGSRLGESWRPRWDPLRVHTPARYDGLPGLPFESETGTYPTKDQMTEYLEKYAQRFGLPVRFGVNVLAITRNERGQYVVECADGRILADQVIVATSSVPLNALFLGGWQLR
jgi:putative flavoprotein involved in K+ transport